MKLLQKSLREAHFEATVTCFEFAPRILPIPGEHFGLRLFARVLGPKKRGFATAFPYVFPAQPGRNPAKKGLRRKNASSLYPAPRGGQRRARSPSLAPLARLARSRDFFSKKGVSPFAKGGEPGGFLRVWQLTEMQWQICWPWGGAPRCSRPPLG